MLAIKIILGIILFIFIILHFHIIAELHFSNKVQAVKIRFLFFTIYPFKEKKKNNKKIKSKKNQQVKKRKVKKLKRNKRLKKELEKDSSELEKALKSADRINNREDAINEILKEAKIDSKRNQDKSTIKDNIHAENKQNHFSNNEIKKAEKKLRKKDKKEKFLEIWEKIKLYTPIGKKLIKKLLKEIRFSNLTLKVAVAKEDAYDCAIAFGKVNAVVFNALSLFRIIFNIHVKHIEISPKFNSNKTDYDLSVEIKIRPSAIIAISVSILVNFLYTTIKQKRKDKKNKHSETEMSKNE